MYVKTFSSSPYYQFVKSLCTALFFALMALFLQIILEKYTGDKEWLFFYPAVFLAALLSGSRGGYFCTVLCMVLALYFLINPARNFGINDPSALIEILIFLAMGSAISFLVAKLQLNELKSRHTAELEKSRGFLDSLLENIPLMVFVKEAKELRFIRFNKAGAELIGYDRDSMLGKNDYDFFPDEQAEFFIQKDREVLSGKTIVDIEEEPIETRLKGTRILHTKKIPLYGPDGNPEYLLGVSEDITEKIISEQQQLKMISEQAALKEREVNQRRETLLAEASTLLASSLDYGETLKALAKLAVTFLGDWCTITIINSNGAFVREVGTHKNPSKIALVETLIKNFPPDDRSIQVMDEGFGGKSFFAPVINDLELKDWSSQGNRYDILKQLGSKSAMIVPITCRSKILGTITLTASEESPTFTQQDLLLAEELGRRAGVAIDNSLLYASAQVAIKARDEFLSIASHELKTPITSLKMQLQMLQRNMRPDSQQFPTPEKMVKSLENSNRQLDRLTVLIEDLLDVSRIETGKLTYKLEKVNLFELISEVVERFLEQLKVAGCSIDLKLEKDVFCECDRYRIEQVMTNLLTNAMKYGAGSKVSISLEQFAETAVIEIKDGGMGISKSSHKKIFERFERAVSSANISGLGLGLYISKQIIDAHLGKIDVESEPGKGALFRIILPTHS